MFKYYVSTFGFMREIFSQMEDATAKVLTLWRGLGMGILTISYQYYR